VGTCCPGILALYIMRKGKRKLGKSYDSSRRVDGLIQSGIELKA